jgi:serine phosphatase RsbU (regulator of sigma subunit)
VQLCQITGPDLTLLDLAEAVEIARSLLESWPAMKIILMADPPEIEPIQDAPQVHAFSRNIDDEEFKEGLVRILQETRPVAWNIGAARRQEDDREAEMPGLVQEISRLRNPEMLTRELVMAGKIQADILPEAPVIQGWDIAATLEPARETSGDFYDFMPLTNRKLGMVVADVTDNGMGAALFMALSSTLFRTFATQFPTLPAVTLDTVSRRILSDTRGSMFVTAFYGVLEPYTGRVVYANAGHPPGLVISTSRGKETIETLRPTGMSLGVMEQANWKQRNTRLGPGDLLILYTDGITEAENPQGVAFGEDRLIDAAYRKAECPAREIQAALLDEVHRFVANTPRQDDIALIVIKREK